MKGSRYMICDEREVCDILGPAIYGMKPSTRWNLRVLSSLQCNARASRPAASQAQPGNKHGVVALHERVDDLLTGSDSGELPIAGKPLVLKNRQIDHHALKRELEVLAARFAQPMSRRNRVKVEHDLY